MQCDICARHHGQQLPFQCPTCARSALYGLRVQLGQALLDNNSFVRQINPMIAAATRATSPSSPATRGSKSRLAIEEASARAERAAERTKDISNHIEILRKEIEDSKADIAKRKAALAQRRSDASSATHNLKARRAATLETVEKGTKKLEYRWNSLHAKTVEARVFLCREAANLYHLRQRRRKKGGSVREDYTIGGVGIVDLRDLNSASPAQITASLTSLTYLLLLTSHYLHLRLPAEILLPQKDSPLPTIFSPTSSYLTKDPPFPHTSLPSSSHTSPSTSHTINQRNQPRPRPLYIDKPLQALAKDDPATYALFIEGVTLLAWDIAWLCRTQGLNVGSNTWEDVCALGRNLYQLLIAPAPSQPQTHPPLSRFPSSKETPTKPTPPPIDQQRSASPMHRNSKQPPTVALGHYSHGTAHSFLSAASGTTHMHGWKLSSPLKIVDKLKATLSSEMGVAEWEYLDPKEWDEATTAAAAGVGKAGDGYDDAVMVGGARRDVGKGLLDDGMGVMSRMEVGEEGRGGDEGDEGKVKGTSGWTKLKAR